MEVAKSTQDGRKEAEPNGLKDLVSLVEAVPDFRILADLAFKIAKEEEERDSPLMDYFRKEIDTKDRIQINYINLRLMFSSVALQNLQIMHAMSSSFKHLDLCGSSASW